MLNVKNAFNNVFYFKLLHNLRKKDMNEKITRWIQNFLKNRSIVIIILEDELFKYEIKIEIS